MAKDPGPLPLLDAVESALIEVGTKMRWADTLAQHLTDTPTMVRVEIEAALAKRVIDVVPDQDRELTEEEEAWVEDASKRIAPIVALKCENNRLRELVVSLGGAP